MILTDKYKSHSLYLDQESEEGLVKLLESMSEEELETFIESFFNPDLEYSLAALETDRPIVPVVDWIEDDYYTGSSGKTIYKPWKDDLIELFESDNYDLAIIQGGIGCQDPNTELITDNGKVMMGDLSKSHRYLSYDLNTGKLAYIRGTQAFVKGKGMMYRVEHEHGSFVASGNHLVLCSDHLYRYVREIYSKPCSIISFHEDSYKIGHSKIFSVEKVKTDWYWDLHVPGTNNYCSGGAVHHNSGKSTFSQLATMRMLYEASCLKSPAQSYGLAANSVISFCNLAPSKETARRVVFEGIGAKIQDSPYFKYDFPPIKDVKDEIIFPKGLTIIAGSSNDTSIIGQNIIGGIFDEGNFMKSASKVKKENMADKAKWGNFGKAGRLFESVRRRMKSRYMRKGRLPGVLMVISSKTTQDAFTEQLVRKNVGVSTTFCRDRNIIDVKRDSFEDNVFKVLVGDEKHRSKILGKDEDESKYDGATIIEIPDDLRTDFEDNVDGALRDIAGISTLAIHPFMSRPEKIDQMIDDRRHPFICSLMPDTGQWDSQLPYKIKWLEIAKKDSNGNWQPLYNPHAKRHVHFDPALTGDGFGLCIAHVAGNVPVESKSGVVEHLPFFVIDFVLLVQGEPGEEVIFKNVRQLCYEFTDHGFHLSEFSMDQYQSREMIQSLRQQGYRAGIYSVDTGQASLDEDTHSRTESRTIEGWVDNKRKQAYRYLRSAIYDNRVRCYQYDPLMRELKGLEETPVMIDHPSSGSKDVADAVCGCIWTLFRANYATAPLPPIKGVSEVAGQKKLDENFVETQVIEDTIVKKEDTAPRRYYKKKKAATIPPKYTKIAEDGDETDLRVKDYDDFDPFLGRG